MRAAVRCPLYQYVKVTLSRLSTNKCRWISKSDEKKPLIFHPTCLLPSPRSYITMPDSTLPAYRTNSSPRNIELFIDLILYVHHFRVHLGLQFGPNDDLWNRQRAAQNGRSHERSRVPKRSLQMALYLLHFWDCASILLICHFLCTFTVPRFDIQNQVFRASYLQFSPEGEAPRVQVAALNAGLPDA